MTRSPALLPGQLSKTREKAVRELQARLKAGGVPDALAKRLAFLPVLARASDVVLIADRTGRSIAEAAASFFAIAGRFGFGRIDAMIEEIPAADYYESLALQKARDSLESAHRDLARSVLDQRRRARRRGRLGGGAWRTHRRDGRAGGENPLRPPAEHGEGDGCGKPVVGAGAVLTRSPDGAKRNPGTSLRKRRSRISLRSIRATVVGASGCRRRSGRRGCRSFPA